MNLARKGHAWSGEEFEVVIVEDGEVKEGETLDLDRSHQSRGGLSDHDGAILGAESNNPGPYRLKGGVRLPGVGAVIEFFQFVPAGTVDLACAVNLDGEVLTNPVVDDSTHR